MAERAGVSAPGVDRVVRAGDTVLLVMPWAGGCSHDQLPPGHTGRLSAVLIYRLATYWLPVLPGWYSWRLLQRIGYV
jgi:hypothetical protein